MSDSIYHMTSKLLKNCILGMKTLSFTQRYNELHKKLCIILPHILSLFSQLV